MALKTNKNNLMPILTGLLVKKIMDFAERNIIFYIISGKAAWEEGHGAYHIKLPRVFAFRGVTCFEDGGGTGFEDGGGTGSENCGTGSEDWWNWFWKLWNRCWGLLELVLRPVEPVLRTVGAGSEKLWNRFWGLRNQFWGLWNRFGCMFYAE